MWSKKITMAAAAGLMAAALTAFPAAAHGHGHHRQECVVTQDTSCPVCTVEGCEEAGRHTHDGHDYCGYEHSSGYCDRSCERAETSSHHGRHHGCRR